MEWLSLHIFYYNRLFLISRLLRGLFDEVLQKKLATKFFYIIYNEQGPHIRVRLLCSHNMYDACLQYCRIRIGNFLSSYPSNYESTSHNGWLPSNTCHVIKYVPEIDRYGGAKRIHIAETQFMYSTLIALKIIEKNYTNYIKNFIAAATLHLSFAYVLFDFDKQKIINFFNFHGSYMYSAGGFSFFAKYEDNISSTLRRTNKHLLTRTCSEPILLEWMLLSRKIAIELSLIPFSEEGNDSPQLWHMLQSYLHMTNNRLGILPSHEHMLYKYILDNIK